MGGGSSGKGGVADATLNVVPFIDLLACTICFLLVSAVWTQMSRMDVDQALPKASKNKPTDPPKPEPKINVAITPTGYLVNLWNADKMGSPKPDLVMPKKIATIGEYKVCRGKQDNGNCQGTMESYKRYDKAKLKETLEQFMKDAGLGDKVKIMVAANDKVQYLHLIGTLDTILGSCQADKVCLKNPSVGDIGLLRAEGFTTFD
jgi:biopolymer transport protein ExbD